MWRRLLSDNAALGLQYAANALVPLLLIPHLVRSLGVEQYGGLALLMAAMGFATIVVQYAFQLTGPADHAALRGRVGARQLFVDILIARLLLLGGVLAVGLAAAAGTRAWLGAQASVWIEALLLLGIPVGAALNAGWYLQAVGQFGALAAISIVSVALALAVGFYGVSAADPSASAWAAAALALGPLLLGAGSLAWAFGRLPAEPARVALSGALRLLAQGRAIFLSQFVAALYSLAGPLVVGALAGVRAAGLYSAVERPAAALQSALTLTHVAAYPRASALYAADDLAGYRRLLLQVLAVYGVMVAGLGVALLLLGEHAVRFLFGAASQEGTTLLWLAYAWIALGIFGPMVTGYFTVRGTPGEILRLTLAVLLVSLPAGAVGAHFLGGSGWLLAAIAGQCVVVARAIHAWRAATLPAHRATLRG